jgi:hypothetical protein
LSWDTTFSHGVAIGIDMFVSKLWFWREKVNMRLSTHCHIAIQENTPGFLKWFGQKLNHLDPGHTYQSLLADRSESQNTLEITDKYK